ncbi:MAG: bifunctional glutamate N-acetyltransferase/amino-acid acetyltransferase ArgJ [Actinomycetales bacterium]|nr:bifunctional glutamate N-acetyltransferase/amino-acid acetyltransferase ArgJ [Actinomycetales bacterium]
MSLPKGFISGSIAAGLKSSGALDLTIIQNLGPLNFGTAVYTTNKVVAAPVIWSKQVTKGQQVSAVVLNSGGANACTGPQGFADTHKTAELVGSKLNVSSGEVVVCSTGLIGEFLPMEKIEKGIQNISLSADGFDFSAQAIMTTDSVPKKATVTKFGVTVSGIAKGAGMLAPAMATMLSVVMTDAAVDPDEATEVFDRAVELTYNRIDSDGCTSTNDTVVFMASGASGVKVSKSELAELLNEVCSSLSAQLIADAEGSSKTVAIKVINAATESDAVNVGRANARNNLLKCAIFGGDPNWGRVLAATGTADAQFDALNIDVKLNGVQVCKASAPAEDRNLVNFDNRLVEIEINLNVGSESATILTNDLTHDYVHENSAYAT